MTSLPPSLRTSGLVLLILLSLVIAFHAFGFQLRLSGDPSFHAHFESFPVSGTLHVLGGGLLLLIGGFQFVRALRQRKPGLHRFMGRVYLLCVLTGGLAGLYLAPFSSGGLVAHYGFGMLAVAFLFTGWQAYAAIRRGDVKTHQAWMMRNYSLAFGAVTLRIYLGVFIAGLGYSFAETYALVSWFSWVPNLLLVEWYLATRDRGLVPQATKSRASTAA